MSLRDLVDADCGGANALMRMGSHFARDHAHKDEGLGGASASQMARDHHQAGAFGAADQMVNDFLGQVRAVPPQTFRMDALLQEMRDIDAQQFHANLARAPPVIDEVHRAVDWAKEFGQHGPTAPMQQQYEPQMLPQLGAAGPQTMAMTPSVLDDMHPTPWHPAQPTLTPASAGGGMVCSRDFFDAKFGDQIPPAADAVLRAQHDHFSGTELSRYLTGLRDQQRLPIGGFANEHHARDVGVMLAKDFFEQAEEGATAAPAERASSATVDEATSWAQDFEAGKQNAFEATQDYNSQFWNRLQNEWKKISDDEDTAQPWLSDLIDFYDPYKEYPFEADNPMADLPDAFARGRSFLEQGDLPSAILCFESAAKQEPDNAAIWELLGHSQAENEKDPSAIAALKRSLDLQPQNAKVMMALAVSYTNESLQAQALGMLIRWLLTNPAYRDLVPAHLVQQVAASSAGSTEEASGGSGTTSSLLHGPELKEVQDIFLRAVFQSQPAIDADIQEALGVLFNLSSEYDKAADCFRAALHVRPDSAKVWNRLGASLANGNRSVEAVESYQRALQLQPGFIRARYNVGIICINLKAYREATEHFLTALNHQATSLRRSGVTVGAGSGEPGTQMSDTIWSTMRMSVSLLGRTDLMPALETRDLAALNAEFGSIGQPE